MREGNRNEVIALLDEASELSKRAEQLKLAESSDASEPIAQLRRELADIVERLKRS